jgi:predicted AlkP superfamily phosphohydrolase/phosphomutase
VEELKRGIEQIRDAKTGEPIVDRVFQREEIYWGPHVEKAPDLLVRWREDISIAGIRLEYQGKGTRDVRATLIPGEDHRVISGDHTLYGVLLAWGKVVRKGWNLDRARLIDLAPTILYAMSIPVPEDMDGVELLDLFQEEFVEAHPRLKRRSSEAAPSSGVETLYSEEEEEKMRERLRGLGYIE